MFNFCVFRICSRVPVMWTCTEHAPVNSRPCASWARGRWNDDVSVLQSYRRPYFNYSISLTESSRFWYQISYLFVNGVLGMVSTRDRIPRTILIIDNIGIFNIFYACGSTTGAPLGGILADNISWRWCVSLYSILAHPKFAPGLSLFKSP